MTIRVCFECGKEIKDPLDYNIMPLDIPYVNLFLHKGCFRLVGGYGNMTVYLSENQKKVYNYSLDRNKEGKTGKYGRKNGKTETIQSPTEEHGSIPRPDGGGIRRNVRGKAVRNRSIQGL